MRIRQAHLAKNRVDLEIIYLMPSEKHSLELVEQLAMKLRVELAHLLGAKTLLLTSMQLGLLGPSLPITYLDCAS